MAKKKKKSANIRLAQMLVRRYRFPVDLVVLTKTGKYVHTLRINQLLGQVQYNPPKDLSKVKKVGSADPIISFQNHVRILNMYYDLKKMEGLYRYFLQKQWRKALALTPPATTRPTSSKKPSPTTQPSTRKKLPTTLPAQKPQKTTK